MQAAYGNDADGSRNRGWALTLRSVRNN
jgi:hypothetical protein